MDIFDMAIDLELSGEQFYRSLAQEAKSPGLKSIFNMLADDETRHREIFEKMSDMGFSGKIETKIIKNANEVFKSVGRDELLGEKDQVEVYKKAGEIEKKSIDYYKELFDLVKDDTSKNTILKIIEEEKKHHTLLEFLIEHVSRPETWVEDAEFYLKENY